MKATKISLHKDQYIIDVEMKPAREGWFKARPAVFRIFKTIGEEIPGKYWEWVEMPDLILAPDSLRFQLDIWLKEYLKNNS